MTDAADLAGDALPVLILIHGATLNGHMWDPMRRHLSPLLRVLAPDLPGHGSRRDEPFTMAAAVATVVAAARSVAPAPVILVGDSLGGYTAMASAAALPAEQLRGLLLSGCSANLEGAVTMSHFLLKTALFKGLLALFGEQRLLASMSGKLRKMLGDADVPGEDIDRMIAAGLSVKVFGEAVAELRGVDYRGKLAAIAQPVLLVNGDRDHVMLRQEDAFLAAAQRARRQHFDCEHGVSLLRSAGLAALVKEYAAEL